MAPEAPTSAGREAVELAALAGLYLDPWQQHVLDVALRERPDGKWSAFEVGLVVPRQNGKGAVLEARELAALFLFGERLILHSAHEFKTATEAFLRVKNLIESTPELERRVAKIRTANGEEGIELRNGARLRFVARSTGSGRGFSGDLVILDEAYNLDGRAMAALLPTLSARPNPQVWYTSSAGMADSLVLQSVRKRAIDGVGGRFAYMEYSAREDADPEDLAEIAQANPGLNIPEHGIPEEFIADERATFFAAGLLGEWMRERMGIWEDTSLGGVFDPAHWASLVLKPGDDDTLANAPGLGIDMNPERTHTAVAAAGLRRDGIPLVDVIRHDPGSDWVVPYVVELVAKHKIPHVAVDAASPAGSLIPALVSARVPVEMVSGRDYAQACGEFTDLVIDSRLRHLAQGTLDAAVAGAKKRSLGDAYAWDRKRPTVDISPLVAVTLAVRMGVRPAPERTFFGAWA